MRFCKLSDEKIKAYYGRYSRLADGGRTTIVAYYGGNAGENGVPNLNLILPFPGAPLDVNGQMFDIRRGFCIPDLVTDMFSGFNESTIIIPGTKVKRPTSDSHKKHFFVTFDPDKVDCVLIGQKCDQNTNESTRNDLRTLAIYTCHGKPKDASDVFWDYYVFPFKMNYNLVADSNDHFLTDAKFGAASNKKTWRKQILRDYLEKCFGNISELISMELLTGGSNIAFSNNPSEPRTALSIGTFTQRHEKGDLYHIETYVIDQNGRRLKPKTEPDYHMTDKSYVDTEVMADDTWENVRDDAVVVQYSRTSLAEAATYTFIQKPALVTTAQLDCLYMLEKCLRDEVHEIVEKYNLFERFALRGKENPWTLQLHDAEVITTALNR